MCSCRPGDIDDIFYRTNMSVCTDCNLCKTLVIKGYMFGSLRNVHG